MGRYIRADTLFDLIRHGYKRIARRGTEDVPEHILAAEVGFFHIVIVCLFARAKRKGKAECDESRLALGVSLSISCPGGHS